ncbi:MAG TPA: superinfection immunity protein, partial [Bacteroidia bacterium]|nr:superinfection immunity protein [Bacteroidia bacterium]
MIKPTTWIIFIVALLVSLVIYFLPTILARKKPNVLKYFFLNLLLGWTILGWIILFIRALKKQKKLSQVESNINTNTIAQLEKLNQLRKDGILTDEEFDGQKQKLLG